MMIAIMAIRKKMIMISIMTKTIIMSLIRIVPVQTITITIMLIRKLKLLNDIYSTTRGG